MLVGHADKLPTKCGDEISIKVSADQRYETQIVRLLGIRDTEGQLAVEEQTGYSLSRRPTPI